MVSLRWDSWLSKGGFTLNFGNVAVAPHFIDDYSGQHVANIIQNFSFKTQTGIKEGIPLETKVFLSYQSPSLALSLAPSVKTPLVGLVNPHFFLRKAGSCRSLSVFPNRKFLSDWNRNQLVLSPPTQSGRALSVWVGAELRRNKIKWWLTWENKWIE